MGTAANKRVTPVAWGWHPPRGVRVEEPPGGPAAGAGGPRGRPPDGGADPRPEGARVARAYAGGVGRRVRADADGGGAGEQEGRAQPPYRRLYVVHGGRWDTAGAGGGRNRRAG